MSALWLSAAIETLGILCLWIAYQTHKSLPYDQFELPERWGQFRKLVGWATVGSGLAIGGLVSLYVAFNSPPHSLQ